MRAFFTFCSYLRQARLVCQIFLFVAFFSKNWYNYTIISEIFMVYKTSQMPFKHLFWFANSGKLNLKKDKHLIIHQVLSHGNMDDVRRLFKIYGKQTIRKEFKKPEPGLYYPDILNFVQYLLGIKKITKKKYLKNLYATPSRNFRR
ncbi:hypothetical protein COU01_00680 [Candidatus Falkowbacteria bacterium CG10_big_fil_rev_8_21_14_0_10_44_15]|uniref:DUF6922 domain-containing protein n=1 Tax=Candidatus Falkowbacteria bacterium CG10_big_fil_rev_8_21_14_0_10_44_15 TaxID=1974569 RepID=A0A2H0V2R4_9BACT|nr:MAG: hypothetical protein COU01_00680 [Candidatus Falkowbacteria bacterium CG10_big_fil_rev_8_21_14_0_10_44_15]